MDLQKILETIKENLEGEGWIRPNHQWSIEPDPDYPGADWIFNVVIQTDHSHQAGHYAWLASGEIGGFGGSSVKVDGITWLIGDGDDYKAAKLEGDTVRIWVRNLS